MITAAILAVSILGQTKAAPLVCPIMLSPVSASIAKSEYNGALFGYCCGGCESGFEANPAKVLADKKLKNKAAGEFLFDPIDHTRIDAKDAKGSADFNGIRYYFHSAANLAAFKKDSKKFAMLPAKESMTCPVSGEDIERYSASVGFTDIDGVRFYFCCPSCVGAYAKDPSKFATAAKAKTASAPKAIRAKG